MGAGLGQKRELECARTGNGWGIIVLWHSGTKEKIGLLFRELPRLFEVWD